MSKTNFFKAGLYQVVGIFWWHTVGKTERPFSGEITVDEKGEFTGKLKDVYGFSNINGRLTENELVFVKEYEDENKKKSASDKPLDYILKNDCGAGFWGSWNYNPPEEGIRPGKVAVCLQFLHK